MARAKGEFPNFDVGSEESQQGKGKKTSSQQVTNRMMSNAGAGGGGAQIDAQSPSNITTPGRSQVKSNIQSIYSPKTTNAKTQAQSVVSSTSNTIKTIPDTPVASTLQLPKSKPNTPTAPIRTIQSIGGLPVEPPTGGAPPQGPAVVYDGTAPSNIVQGPMFKNSQTNVRPDGVIEILGPGGVVLEEIGQDGKIISDPIKDAGFDPKNPPASIQALRDEFAQHVSSGADESGKPFYVSEETKAAMVADGLGNKGGALTAKEQAEKMEYWLKVKPENRPAGFQVLINDLTKKGLLPNGSEVTTKGGKKAKEKIIKPQDIELNAQDYVATIKQVLDYNRIKVSLSYNEGVDLYKHKGDDQVANKFKNAKVNYIKSNINRYKTYAKVDNEYYLVTNSKLGIEGKQRIFKTKSPLSSDVEVGDKFTLVEKRLPNYSERVRLVPFESTPNDGLFLRLPNFNSVDNPINFQGTGYQTHTELISENEEDTRDIERLISSSSLLDVQPNIDYQKTTSNLNFEEDDTGFGNFVHFSSAERRLHNFKKKLQLIEGYTSDSSSLSSVASSLSTVQDIEKKRQRVKNSFDPYENFLYYEATSYVSSSDGQFHDTSWPKSSSFDSSGKQINYILDSGDVDSTLWYNNMILSASDYDRRNMNSLKNSLPEHVYSDTQNNVFLEFMDMVGQQFDEIYTYVNRFTDINKRVDKISEGISKDVAREYAKSLGLELFNGNDLVNLPEYVLGKNKDGTPLYESPQEEVTEKIWKRVLANLPFFVKSKGTERALRGLLSCYGIPSSILRVREYGGPDDGNRVSYEIKRKFTRATDFKSGQYIKTKWDAYNGLYPDTVEFRFRSPKSQDQVILQKSGSGVGSEGSWAISLEDNGSSDDYGYLRFTISGSDGRVKFITSSLQEFYNDDMWSVMLTRTSASDGSEFTSESIHASASYELTAKQYDSTRKRIVWSTSETMVVTSSNMNAAYTSSGHVYLGGDGNSFGTQFSGSLMEYRLWSEPLSSAVFDNHVRSPKTYNGNSHSSSYDELLVRYELNDNRNIATFGVTSSAHLKSYEEYSVDTDGFTGNFSRTIVDQEKLKVPNVGPSRRNATKIRIDNSYKQGTIFNDKRVLWETPSIDKFTKDDNKLGVYFSPSDVVNEDIIYSIADFNFDDYIGDPRDQKKYFYKDLRQIRREYFKRYWGTNNFWDYLRILKFYDSSIFDALESLLPAKANSTLGILIEPNILERSKQVIGRDVEFDNKYFENAGHFDEGLKVTRYISGSDDNYFEMSGEYTTYNSEINLAYFDTGSSLGFLNNRSIVKLDTIDKKSEYGSLYATASVTLGGTNTIFTETLQPNISASRVSERNQIQRFFYATPKDALINNPNSSSFEPAEFQSMAYDTALYRLFVEGIKITRDNSIDGEEPIIVNEVAPTLLKTKDSEVVKLKVER